jgi:hypothetical protein
MSRITSPVTEFFSLEGTHPYSGKIFAKIGDLARLKPILAAIGNNNELAGSLLVDWEGSGRQLNLRTLAN